MTLETISAALASCIQKMTTIENTLTTHSDELTELTTRLDQLEKANDALAPKAEDLENHSRRQNLRIVGLTWRSGGTFTIGIHFEAFPNSYWKRCFPQISRAGQSALHISSKACQETTSIIVRFHRYQDKFDGHSVLFFPDECKPGQATSDIQGHQG